MNIAFVYPNSWEHAYPQFRDDIDRQVWCQSDSIPMKFARALLPFGVKPVIYYLSETARTRAEFVHRSGFTMRRVPVRVGAGTWDREYSLDIIADACRGGHDLLHFISFYRNGRYPDMYDLFALWCAARGQPFVADYHAGNFPGSWQASPVKRLFYAPRRALKAFALRRARRLLVINALEIERLCNPQHPLYYGHRIPRERCVFLPLTVDRAVFQPMEKAEACRLAGLDPARRYLLYVGFLREPKGVQDLVSVMPKVLTGEPRAHLLIAGNGDYEPALRELVRKLGLDAAVTFIGAVAHDRLCPLYNAGEAHVLPSYTEGLPQVILEALACNTPSIGSRVGGIPELLGEAGGRCFDAGNREQLLEAVGDALCGAVKIVPAAREAILARFSLENTGRILFNTYREALGLKGD